MDTVFLFYSISQVYVIVFVVFRSLSACDKQKCRNFAENLIEYKNNKKINLRRNEEINH